MERPPSQHKGPRLASSELRTAFDAALAFPVQRATALRQPPGLLGEQAAEEASFGRVAIGAGGFTAGMTLHVAQPARILWAEWCAARTPFDVLLEPAMRDITAVAQLTAEVEGIKRRRDAESKAVEDALDGDAAYRQVRERFAEAEDRFKQFRQAHGNRDANMLAAQPFYYASILLIGVAEWLINYDTLLSFTGIPAIASGATLVLGLLLAFAAHGHGTLLRQWAHRFGAHRDRGQRLADVRLLLFSTFGLLLVLGAAGGTRYSAAMRALADQPAVNILGAVAEIQVNPLRDVLLSLLANVAAWAVGVFIAYAAHDEDPDYMDATRQHRRWSRRFLRRRRHADGQLRTIAARSNREIGEKETAARTRLAGVVVERDMLAQVDAHEAAVEAALQAALRSNAETYRDALAQLAVVSKGGLVLTTAGPDGGQALSPHEYRIMALPIDGALLRGHAA